MNIIVAIIAIAAALIIGGLCGFMIFRFIIKGKYNEMVSAAQKEAEVIKEKKLLEVKEKFLNKKSELEKEVQQRNQHIQQSENKLKQREISLNQRQEELGRRKNDLDNQQTRIDNEKKLLNIKQEELEKMQLQERAKLEELSGLSADEAKARLVESLKDEAKTDAAAYINEIMDEAKLNANAQAKKIIIQTIQRVATETAVGTPCQYSTSTTTMSRVASSDAKAVTSVPWKQPAAWKSSSTIRLRPLSSVPSTPSAVRPAVWLSTSSWLTAASTPPVSRKWWLRSRNSWRTRLSRLVSAPPSTLVSMACILNSSASSVR